MHLNLRNRFSLLLLGTVLLFPVELIAQSQERVIRVADNSPHLEAFNQALLAAHTGPEWETELARYLGQ